MRTVVLSDLHLGVRAGTDLARQPEVRTRLVEVARGADRIVLLGDVFELRERSLTDILALARPLFADLAGALGDGGELVIVPGNHDHSLAARVTAAVGGPERLGSLEARARPVPPDPLARLAEELRPARLELAYPGLWLAPGVYATHGHFMDVHSPIPMVECLALAISARLQGGPPGPGSSPVDYERIAAPVYRASERVGLGGVALGRAGRGDLSIRVYERLAQRPAGDDPPPSGSTARTDDGQAKPGDAAPAAARPAPRQVGAGDRALELAVPAAVRALNRLGLGPFDADLSGRALRRAGLRAMAEVIDRLGVEAEYVIFGHTHRAGPLANDVEGWTVPAGAGRGETRLLNTGNWVYAPAFLPERPGGPYWPGRCAVVEDGRPPQLAHPLADTGHEELAPAR